MFNACFPDKVLIELYKIKHAELYKREKDSEKEREVRRRNSESRNQ